jgi:hypothetical protein
MLRCEMLATTLNIQLQNIVQAPVYNPIYNITLYRYKHTQQLIHIRAYTLTRTSISESVKVPGSTCSLNCAPFGLFIVLVIAG